MKSYGTFYAQFARNRTVDWESYYVDYEELEGLISQICHVQNRIALRNHLQNNQRASVVWVDHDSEEDELTCDQMEEEFQQKVADFVNLFSENDMKVSEFFNENFHSAVKRLNGIRKYIAYYPKEEQDENSLQEAIIETYRMFLLLKNYASINFSAFHEILKNYDRRTGRMISPWFMISQSHSSKSLLTQAKGIQNFIGDIENLYANRFYKGYGSLIKARRDLLRRRQPHHMRNDQTYSIGFHSGFCVPLAVLFLGMIVQFPDGLLDRTEVVAVWPVYRGTFCLIFLGFSWAFVTLAFETRRINYMFIMNLNPKSVIRLHEILTSGFFLVAIWLSSAYLFIAKTTGHLDMFPFIPQQVYPLAVVVSVLSFALWPCGGVHHETRTWLSTRLMYIVAAPMTPLGFSESFVADYLTSFVKPLFDLEYIVCYYGRGDWWREDSTVCLGSNKTIALPILSALPLFYRLMQQFKRYHVTKQAWPHMANAMKYMIALGLVIISSFHDKWTKEGDYWTPSRIIWFAAMTVSTLYSYTWDICMDWGLVEWHYGRPSLRLNWTYGPKWMTVVPAILNLAGRFVWALTLTATLNPFASLPPQLVTLLVALIEIVRRSQWAIMRLENEHVNNYGKYRAVAEIPLAFDVDTHVVTYHVDRLIRHLKKAQADGRALTPTSYLQRTRTPQGSPGVVRSSSRKRREEANKYNNNGNAKDAPKSPEHARSAAVAEAQAQHNHRKAEGTPSRRPTLVVDNRIQSSSSAGSGGARGRSSHRKKHKERLTAHAEDDTDHLTRDEKVVAIHSALESMGIGRANPVMPANRTTSAELLAMGEARSEGRPMSSSSSKRKAYAKSKATREGSSGSLEILGHFSRQGSSHALQAENPRESLVINAQHISHDDVSRAGSNFVSHVISRPHSRQASRRGSTSVSRQNSTHISPIGSPAHKNWAQFGPSPGGS